MKQENTIYNSIQPMDLKGWLIPVGVGLVLISVIIVTFLFYTYIQVFMSLAWALFTTPVSDSYIEFFAPLVIGEVVFNAIFFLCFSYTAYLFFTKKKQFSKWITGIVASFVGFIIIDSMLVSMVMPNVHFFDNKTLARMAATLILSVMFISYIRVSKRVKNTFVK